MQLKPCKLGVIKAHIAKLWKMVSGSLLALQKFVVLYPAWFNKLVLIDGTDLGTSFEKLIMDGLNQKLEDNKQSIVKKIEVAT